MEAQLQSSQADLKSAQKRIDQLHGALNQEEGEGSSGEEDDRYLSRSMDDSLEDHLSSLGSSDQSLGFSDEDDEFESRPPAPRRKGLHNFERSRGGGFSKDLSPPVASSRRKSASRDDDDDEFSAARRAREQRLKQLEEEERELEAKRKARQERMRQIEREEEESEALRRKPTAVSRKDSYGEEKKSRSSPKTTSYKKKAYDDDDEDDDDDLEEFLLKQRERMNKKLKDSEDEGLDDDEDKVKATRGISSRVSNEDLSSVRAGGKEREILISLDGQAEDGEEGEYS